VKQSRGSARVLGVVTLLLAVGYWPCHARIGEPANLDNEATHKPSNVQTGTTPAHPPITDIVIPPLPDAFTQSSDPNVRRAVELLAEASAFKELVIEPSDIFGETESEVPLKSAVVSVGVIPRRGGCVKYSPDEWVRDCEPMVRPGVVSCRSYRYNGSLCVEWFDSRTPLTWMVEIRMDGTTGSATYENFNVQSSVQNLDQKYAAFSHSQHIEHPSFDEGYVDGPMLDVEFLVEGEATLYTPYSEHDLSTRVIKTRHHKYDQFEGRFICDHSSTLSFMPNGAYHAVHLCLNLDTNELFTCWVAYWKDEEGGWMTFDEDGRLNDSGEFG
jgi:hypothetical protein